MNLYMADAGNAVMAPVAEAMNSCVTAARIPGMTDAFLLGDSKLPGTTFRFTGDELRANHAALARLPMDRARTRARQGRASPGSDWPDWTCPAASMCTG